MAGSGTAAVSGGPGATSTPPRPQVRAVLTRAYVLVVLVVCVTTIVAIAPSRLPSATTLAVLGSGVAAASWLYRHEVAAAASGRTTNVLELLVVPFALVFPPAWVGLVVMLGHVGKATRARWYRGVYNAAVFGLVALGVAVVSQEALGDAPSLLRVLAVACLAGLLIEVATAVAIWLAVAIETGRATDFGMSRAFLFPLLAASMLGALVYYASHNQWSLALVAGLVVLLERAMTWSLRAEYVARQHQAERADLLRLVLSAGDRQRRAVAREIHDGPLQVVVATRVLLESSTQRVETATGEPSPDLRAISGHLLDAINDLRSALSGAYEEGLVLAGLRAGLSEVLEQYRGAFRHGARLELADNLDLPVGTTAVLLQVLREATVNAAKHAQADSLLVRVHVAGSAVVAEVIDDGIGVHAGTLASRHREGHLGVVMMHERARAAGGTFAIERNSPRGTRVSLTLPLQPPDAPPAWEEVVPQART